MTAIGNSIQASGFNNVQLQSPATLAGNSPVLTNNVSNLVSSDTLAASNVNSGGIPAVKQSMVGRFNSSIARGATNVANSTVSATREMGNVIAKDVLPKPEPLSTTLIRNKFLSAVLVGGFVNGIQSMVKVAKGEYTQEEAKHQIVKNTSLGAIAGLSFAGGMGATASVLGGFMPSVPLSIIGLTIGTLSSIGITELVKGAFPFFSDKK